MCIRDSILTKLCRWKLRGPVIMNNRVYVRKTTWIYLSYGIRILAELSFVLSQFMRVTHRQTDGQTDTFAVRKTALHICSAVTRKSTFIVLLQWSGSEMVWSSQIYQGGDMRAHACLLLCRTMTTGTGNTFDMDIYDLNKSNLLHHQMGILRPRTKLTNFVLKLSWCRCLSTSVKNAMSYKNNSGINCFVMKATRCEENPQEILQKQ